eukprot:scaffold81618_cov46-Attheya_sp.AAC.6
MSGGRDGKRHGLAYVIYKESISNRLLGSLLKTGYLVEQCIYLGNTDVSSSMINKTGEASLILINFLYNRRSNQYICCGLKN